MRGGGGGEGGGKEGGEGGGEGGGTHSPVLPVLTCSRLATKLKQLAEQYDAREEVSSTAEDGSVS